MSDAPKLRAFVTAMLFGEGQSAAIVPCFSVAPTPEIASAHAVASVIQTAHAVGKPLPPLSLVSVMEVEERLRYIRPISGQPATVTPLRVAEPGPPTLETAPQQCSHITWNGTKEHCPTCGKVMLANYSGIGRPYTPPDGSSA